MLWFRRLCKLFVKFLFLLLSHSKKIKTTIVCLAFDLLRMPNKGIERSYVKTKGNKGRQLRSVSEL